MYCLAENENESYFTYIFVFSTIKQFIVNSSFSISCDTTPQTLLKTMFLL